MKTERQKQEQIAADNDMIFTHVYRCDDGAIFEAVASSEKGAFRVLNAERPGMHAHYCGVKE